MLALGALVQHCCLLNTVSPCLHDVGFSFCSSGVGVSSSLPQDPDPGRFGWAGFPHIHTGLTPSTAHPWNGTIQSCSLGLWCFHRHPGWSGKGPPSVLCGIWREHRGEPGGFGWDNVVISRVQQSSLMAEACKETAIYQTIYWRQMGNFPLKLVQIRKKTGKEGVGGTEMVWKLFWLGSVKPACQSHEECNLPQ